MKGGEGVKGAIQEDKKEQWREKSVILSTRDRRVMADLGPDGPRLETLAVNPLSENQIESKNSKDTCKFIAQQYFYTNKTSLTSLKNL